MESPPHEILARLWLCSLLAMEGGACRAAALPQDSPEFWDAAQRIAVGHGLAPLLARHASRGLWPKENQKELDRARSYTLAANLVQLDAGNELLGSLENAGIPVAPIKGLALLRAGIYEPGERPMTDIDLLVRAADIERARDLVLESGWEVVDCSRAARLRHHHWVFLLPGQPAVGLDLHWTPATGERVMPDWDALGVTEGSDPSLSVQLFFLAANTARHGFTGKLLFLHDLARILHVRHDEIDWGFLEVLATQTRSRRAVTLALACAAEAFGPRVPARSGFEPSAYDRRILKSLWPLSSWESRWGGRALRLATADSPAGTLRTGGKGLLNLLRR